MTRNRRIQAVLLAAIMAISVVGMSVAFAGSAAAAGGDGSATDQDLGSTVIQDSTTQIAQEVDVSSSAGTLDIDMIEINNSAGTAPDSAISSIAVYEDDGNGQFDGDGNEQNKLGSTANPNLGDSGAVIGSDDDNTISSVAGGETNKYLIAFVFS